VPSTVLLTAIVSGEPSITRGAARRPSPWPPRTWDKNPEGDQTRAYARVTINGVFNENLDGLDTELGAGDRVGLLYPLIYCC